jgi:hypothetical protein
VTNRWLIGGGIGCLVGFALCAGLVTLIFTTVFALTRPVVDASEAFLAQMGQGEVAAAYASTADGFRAQQDEESFAAAVKQLGLDEYASVSWSNRRINNQEGTAEGTVTTTKGATKPIALRLIFEGGAWKVVGVRYGGVEMTSIRAVLSVPAKEELDRLVLETLLGFNQAVRNKDFTAFHEKLSAGLKKGVTPEKLLASFHDFVDKKIDISPIKTAEPQFAPPPSVNENGVLIVNGHYPTQPTRVRFRLNYVKEGAMWKLSFISVNVGDDPAPKK